MNLNSLKNYLFIIAGSFLINSIILFSIIGISCTIPSEYLISIGSYCMLSSFHSNIKIKIHIPT